MAAICVSIPDELEAFVELRVSEGGYGSVSEYVGDLIRRDRDRRQLRTALLEGAESPIIGDADATYFAALRGRVRGAV